MKQWSQSQLDGMLRDVADQALSLGIPVSRRIQGTVAVNPRAKARFGCCRKIPGFAGASFRIEVSKAVLEAEEPVLRSILAHEVLHTCPGCQNHQARWQAYGQAMEDAFGYRVRRTWTYDAMGLADPRKKTEYRYALRCTACGQQILRRKRSPLIAEPHRYRCRCGGTLQAERLPGQ